MADVDRVAKRLVELLALEETGEFIPVMLTLGPFGAYITVAALQLAYSHPGLSQQMKDAIWDVGHTLQIAYEADPLLHEFMERGWDRDQDVPADPARCSVCGRVAGMPSAPCPACPDTPAR